MDNDGEFLLIEAANVLPQWITPELANFRVCSFRYKRSIKGVADKA